MDPVTITSVDELTAVIPHLLGFNPVESLVVVPLNPGPPVARVDLPVTAEERDLVSDQLLSAYLRHAEPGSRLAILSFSDDLHATELASQQLADALTAHGIDVPVRVWATQRWWTDLDTGEGGDRTPEAQISMDAELVGRGRRAPVTGRGELAEQLAGDPGPVADELAVVRDRAVVNGPAAERAWVADRIDQFDGDQRVLSDRDAARLLVAVHDTDVRDAALMRITTQNASSSRALWADLTRRAPDEVRTPAASILGFASWISGDGAGAWVALDQIPTAEASYPLANMLTQTLHQAVPPSAWDNQPLSRRVSEPPAVGGYDGPQSRPPTP